MIRRRRIPQPPSGVQRALHRSRRRLTLAWLRPRWISVLGAVACFSGALTLMLSPVFRVEQVALRHGSDSSAEAVTRATQLSHVVGRNIFLVNAQSAADEVAQVPSVLRARVVPHLPNVVEIEIVERTPIARWQAGTSAFLVDDQGFLLADAAEAGAMGEGLLVVRDTTGRELRLGDQINQHTLLAARELVTAMPAAGVRARDVELSLQGLIFTTDAGWRVIFGETEALNAKLANLASMVDMAQKSGMKIAVLDLRPKERPYYQLAQ